MEGISPPEDKFIEVNGLKLHYLDWGNEKEPVLVLLHGLCGNAHYWDFFAERMNNDYHILALDQRGHGDSDHAENYGPRYYVTDLEEFAAKLGLDKIHLAGHSMGGINGIIYAARHPELVSALVIVDIGPEISKEGIERMERDRDSEPDAFGSEEEAITYMKRMEPRQAEDFIRHQVKYALKRDTKAGWTFKYDKALRGVGLRSPEWLWEYVGQVICPSLLVHGTESDMLSADVARTMVEKLSRGSIVDIEHAGHSVPGDNPQAFESAVRNFLKGLDL